MTGTPAETAARLRALSSAGITEIAYQPMGQDIPRELAAFAEAAGSTARPGVTRRAPAAAP